VVLLWGKGFALVVNCNPDRKVGLDAGEVVFLGFFVVCVGFFGVFWFFFGGWFFCHRGFVQKKKKTGGCWKTADTSR